MNLNRVLLICALGCSLCRAERAAIPTSAGKELFPVKEVTLTNGLRILTVEDHHCPIVAVQVWYHVGSVNEPEGRRGFAHLFEHMMFRGTDRLGPTDHMDLIKSVGGNCNAYTAFDETCYHETLPAQQLELAFWLESERMAFLTVDGAGFTTERKVVEEERRMNLNQPYGDLPERGLPIIFGQHPYGHSPIGAIADLRQATPSDVHDWWKSWYTPNNATLVVVGDVKADQVRALAQKYFCWMPAVPTPARDIPAAGTFEAPKEAVLKLENAPAPGVGMVWRTVPEGHPDALGLELLAIILGGGESSRLYQRLVAEEHVAVIAQAMQYGLQRAGGFGAGAALSPLGGDPARTLVALRAEVERLRNEGVSEEELDKARNQAVSRLLLEAQSVSGKAQLIGRAAVIGRGVAELNGRIERMRQLRREELQRLARSYLDPQHALTITVPRSGLMDQLSRLLLSKRKSEEEAPVAIAPTMLLRGRPGVARPPDLAIRPPLNEGNPPMPSPVVHEHRLTNGLRVLILPDPKAQVVQAMLAWPFGAWAEDKPGAASMALTLACKATEAHDEKALAEELDRYAIRLSGLADQDDSRIEATCLSDHADRAFSLLAETVERPTFPEGPLRTALAQALTELKIVDSDPAKVADQEFRRSLFRGHPYARRPAGESADISALQREDLAQFWAQAAQPDHATIIIAGALSDERALTLAERCFGTWESGGSGKELTEKSEVKRQKSVVRPVPAPPTNGSPTHIVLVDRPGLAQTEIRVGGLGIVYADPDKPVANLVSSYFGGSFGSRLMKAIRIEKGATYGVSGGFQANRLAGSFMVSTFTKTASSAETLRMVLDEMHGLLDRAPSNGELSLHRRYFLGSAAARFETPERLADQFARISMNRLPLDYVQRSFAKINSADAAQCQSLVRRTVDAEHLLIVVVGDAGRIREDLEKIAPVTVVGR